MRFWNAAILQFSTYYANSLLACMPRTTRCSGAALKILDEVRELGLDVGEILYNTVMEACGAAGQTKMSLSLLEVR